MVQWCPVTLTKHADQAKKGDGKAITLSELSDIWNQCGYGLIAITSCVFFLWMKNDAHHDLVLYVFRGTEGNFSEVGQPVGSAVAGLEAHQMSSYPGS